MFEDSDNGRKDNRPAGQKLRDLINNALSDPNAKKIQLAMLSQTFNGVARALPQILASDLQTLYVVTDGMPPNRANLEIVKTLTLPSDAGGLDPAKRIGLQISNSFTNFTFQDIAEMPSYILMHEAARDLDVAISLVGVVAEDGKEGSPLGKMPPMIVLDPMKSYLDGSDEFYPDLPKKKPLSPPKKPDGGGPSSGMSF